MSVTCVCVCVCVRASLVSLLVLPYTRFYVCHIGMCDGARCVSIIGTKTMCVVLSCDVCCYYFAVLVVVFCCRGRGYDQKDFPQPQPLDSVVRSYFTHSGYFKTITETQTNINTHTHIRTIIVLFMLNAVVLFVASLPRFVFVTPLHLIWSAIYLCTFFSSGRKYRYKMKCAPVIIIIIIVIKYTRFKSNSANRSYVNGWTYAMLMWSLAVANICYCSLLCIRFYWFCLIILTELEYTKRRNNNNHIQSAGIFCQLRQPHTHAFT